jgi:hypothetical protein
MQDDGTGFIFEEDSNLVMYDIHTWKNMIHKWFMRRGKGGGFFVREPII